jgi:predicted DNA-binding transcriptional regulator AlpA
VTPAMHLRLIRLGLLTTQDLQALFDISDDTITRAYKRGDLPPPVTLFGRNIWSIEAIQQHLAQRLEHARTQAEREQAQRDTKVAALYGGDPHGRRP